MSDADATSSPQSVYVAGLHVDCRSTHDPVPFLGAGWHPPEQDFTWMDGREAELTCLLRLPDRPLVLRLDLVPFPKGALPHTIEVFVNGLRCGFREVPAAGQHDFAVPVEAFRGRQCRIALHCATAVIGTDVGLDDTRRLGIGLVGWVLEPA